MSDPLPESVSALTRYFVGNATLGETLTRVSQLTLQAVPNASFVGITMMVDGKIGTYAFTHPMMTEIDRAQYQEGRGPCVDAYLTGATLAIDSTASDERWPAFARTALAHGVRSTLSLPMVVNGSTLGALNLYAESDGAFGLPDVESAQQFAAQAAFVLANAQAYWDARMLSEDLTTAMRSRAVIEQAKGIIMHAQGVSADEAFQRLAAQSQHENVKLRDLAAQLVERAEQRRRAD